MKKGETSIEDGSFTLKFNINSIIPNVTLQWDELASDIYRKLIS